MTDAVKQKRKPCDSCPFMSEGGDRSVCFEPETLKKTVVDYLRNGGIHPCHSAKEFMCTGYLSFAEQTLRAGAESLQMVRISQRLGMFDWNMVNDELPVYKSIEDMLEDHRFRLHGFKEEP